MAVPASVRPDGSDLVVKTIREVLADLGVKPNAQACAGPVQVGANKEVTVELGLFFSTFLETSHVRRDINCK